jgi:hypothetical protein
MLIFGAGIIRTSFAAISPIETNFRIGAGIIVNRPQKSAVSPHLLTRPVLIFGARIISTIRPTKLEP